MTEPSPTNLLPRILKVLNGVYADAVRAHLEYEVFAGVRNKKSLQEFESALAHLAAAIVKNDDHEIDHLISHCQRVACETTEYIAEGYLESIRDRFDPYYNHPRIARLLLLTKPSFLDAHYESLREVQDLIAQGRSLKGN